MVYVVENIVHNDRRWHANTQMGLSLISPMQQGFKTIGERVTSRLTLCVMRACPRFDLRLKSLTGAIAAAKKPRFLGL